MSAQVFIVDRPMYRLCIFIDGTDIDVEITLTAKGRSYASRRARGAHHYLRDDEDGLTEILHARDTYYPQEQTP